jgi:hypothetical protein
MPSSPARWQLRILDAAMQVVHGYSARSAPRGTEGRSGHGARSVRAASRGYFGSGLA